MSIAQYLSKFALGVNSQGVLSAAKGGTGNTNGGGGGSSPTVTSISYPGDDTAADPAGGQTITITGTNFATGVKILLNSTPVSVVSRVSATTITFTAPSLTVGSYPLYVVNPDGTTAILVPGLQVSAMPVWTTSAGTLGTVTQLFNFNTTIAATGDGTISYSIASGTLPTGITLNSSTGDISGTAPTVASSTTYSFTVRSTDAQNQDTDRAFSITVVPVNPPPTVEYLVVAGGGGGGGQMGGGGGAGGYRTATGYSVTAGSPITVTVGAGGSGGGSARGINGQNSVFGSITSLGGGGGGTYTNNSGNSGGSGGGAGGYESVVSSGGAGTAGQGNAGGGSNGSNGKYLGGGGGGAGGTGITTTPGSFAQKGDGGVGQPSSISGSSTYYAGGGGGGGFYAYNADYGSRTGLGGLGGGGDGYHPGNAANGQEYGYPGTDNTGGGGGGADFASGIGGNGGSGIVIIRYSDTYGAAAATTGSPTITVTGGYRIYKFTSSGTITF